MSQKFFQTLFFICCLTVVTLVHSQNVTEDLRQMQEAYDKYPDISMNITYKAFGNHNSANLVESETGKWYKHGDIQFADLLGKQTLATKEYYIVVDTAEQQLIVLDPPKTGTIVSAAGDIEKLINEKAHVEYFEPNGSQKAYRVKLTNERYTECSTAEFFFSRNTHFVEKIILYYDTEYKLNETYNSPTGKPRIEISFSSINTSPKFPENI